MNRANVASNVTTSINTLVTAGDITTTLRPLAQTDLINQIVILIQSAENSAKTHASDLAKHSAILKQK